jgi:hypothetical protein
MAFAIMNVSFNARIICGRVFVFVASLYSEFIQHPAVNGYNEILHIIASKIGGKSVICWHVLDFLAAVALPSQIYWRSHILMVQSIYPMSIPRLTKFC